MEFKDKLKALRKMKGISQQALADAIFVSRSAVAKWENGLGFPSEASMAALQEYFGTAASYFDTPEPEQVIVRKNKHIRRLHVQFTALLLAIILAATLIVPNTNAGMKLGAILFQPFWEPYAKNLLSDSAQESDHFWGYEVIPYPDSDAVFFNNYSWGYRGLIYSADGEPVGFQGMEVTFYRCGPGRYYWSERTGDNWMYIEHITGNWYWYEMHF